MMFVLRLPLSGLLAVWCASATATDGGTFVAFNDLVPNGADFWPDSRPAEAGCSWNRFTHGRHWERGGGVLAAEPQPLVDSENRVSSATVRFEEVVTHENTINNHILPITLKQGSPAWDEFADCFCPDATCDETSGECDCAALDGSLSYNDAPGWEFKYVFDGLDPRCEAEVVFFVERGSARHDRNTDYDERYSVFTLSNVTRFIHHPTLALRSLQGGVSLAIRAGNNVAGHVAKWSNISHNGSFTVSASHDQAGELSDLSPPPHAYKAYAGGVFKLSQVCESVITTTTTTTTSSSTSGSTKTTTSTEAIAAMETITTTEAATSMTTTTARISTSNTTTSSHGLSMSNTTTSSHGRVIPGGHFVSIALSLAVEDPTAFAADSSSPAFVAQGVAAVTGVDVSNVTVALSVVWRRLLAARRLAGVVAADTSIAVADAAAAELFSARVASVKPAALASSVNEALASAGKANIVSVMEISAPVIGPPAPQTVEASRIDAEDRVELQPETETSDGERGDGCTMQLVIVSSAVTALVAFAAVACLVLKNPHRRVWPAPRVRSYTKGDLYATTSDASGDHEANTDAHVISKIAPDKDDDVNSECSTIVPSDNASTASPPLDV